MTGISIGILLTTPPNTYWPYVVGAAIAIGSKYAVRHRGRHVFNPSNLAVALLFLVAPQYGISNPSQWTNQIWPAVMILLLGAVVVTRARRWDVVTGFVITYVLLALVRSLVQGLPLGWTLGPALGAEFQLFTFFMLTDPKTTPLTVRGRVTAGVLVGVLDAVMRVARITYSPFYALVLTCMLVPWFDYRFAWTRVSVVPRPSAAS